MAVAHEPTGILTGPLVLWRGEDVEGAFACHGSRLMTERNGVTSFLSGPTPSLTLETWLAQGVESVRAAHGIEVALAGILFVLAALGVIASIAGGLAPLLNLLRRVFGPRVDSARDEAEMALAIGIARRLYLAKIDQDQSRMASRPRPQF